jgi:hypothetical protein
MRDFTLERRKSELSFSEIVKTRKGITPPYPISPVIDGLSKRILVYEDDELVYFFDSEYGEWE